MTGKINIRKMTKHDIDGVIAIEILAFKMPWPRSAFEEELGNNELAFYLVLTDENNKLAPIIGYVGMWKIIDEAHVTNVAIAPKYQNQGWGSILLAELIWQAKEMGADKMTLEVRESNNAARHLYEKFNFKVEGVRKGYYSDTNENALIMWKDPL